MQWSRVRVILSLSLPIMGGMVSQNILNLVDVLFVKELGDVALAAAGLGGFASFAAVALLMGLSTGVQATAARRYGEKAYDQVALSLNAGLLLAVLFGSLFTLVLISAVPWFYPWLNADPLVQEVGAPYLEIRLLGTVFLAVNYSFRGFWNGIGSSKVYMGTLLVMHLCNALFNYVLIFGHWGAPELGLAGAAWGTTLALGVGSCIYMAMAVFKARHLGFFRAKPNGKELRQIIRVSLPSGIQQLFFASGLLVFNWIVGHIGTQELAACNILINLLLVALLPGLGLGLGAATLVGQALGRQDPDDAARWGWQVAIVGFFLITLIALPMVVAPEWVLSHFAPDQELLALARWPLIVTGILIPLDVFGVIMFQSLLGAGDAKRATVVSLGFQWGLFLPIAFISGPVLGGGLLLVWSLHAGYRVLQAGVYATLWYRRGWVGIKV